MIREHAGSSGNGVLALVLGIAGIIGSFVLLIASARRPAEPIGLVLAMGGLFASLLLLKGLIVVNPNEARVLQLFGNYRGTVKSAGLRWVNPLTTARRVSL